MKLRTLRDRRISEGNEDREETRGETTGCLTKLSV